MRARLGGRRVERGRCLAQWLVHALDGRAVWGGIDVGESCAGRVLGHVVELQQRERRAPGGQTGVFAVKNTVGGPLAIVDF